MKKGILASNIGALPILQECPYSSDPEWVQLIMKEIKDKCEKDKKNESRKKEQEMLLAAVHS